jgi:hypothetical protein
LVDRRPIGRRRVLWNASYRFESSIGWVPLLFKAFLRYETWVLSPPSIGAKNMTGSSGTLEGGVTNSPYCAGIILGSMVWLGWAWFTRIVYSPSRFLLSCQLLIRPSTDTPGYATANLLFAVLFILCAYNFFRAITLDPGVCPVLAGEEEKKLVSVVSYLQWVWS